MSKLIVSSAKSPFQKKENEVEDIQAIILNRSNRKFWYIKYTVFFKNSTKSEPKEESTKVLKTEKTQKWMEQKYLPVWLARKKEELKVDNINSQTFGYYCSLFLKNYQINHDYKNVENRANRILCEFENKNIKDITNLEIKEFLNSLINLNSKAKEKLSKNSKLKYLRIFHGVFDLAEDDRIIDKNLTYNIKFEKEKREKNTDTIKPFEKDEVLKLLNASKDPKYGELLHYYLGIAFNQGMSPSEIIGLQIDNIDLVNQTININQNRTKGKLKETKTEYRDRIIPIFDTTLPYITELIKMAKEKNTQWLLSWKDGSPLKDIQNIRGDREITKDGKRIKNTTKWYKLLEDTGIKYRDLKNCRHTFAVSAIESKQFTMQQIAELLGHADLQMIVNHYAKYIEKKAITANRKINLFGDTLGDT